MYQFSLRFMGFMSFWGSVLSIWVELRGNIFFPHFVQSQIRSKDSLTQRRAKVVGISWSYSTVGFGAFKKNRMPRWGQEDGLTGTGRWGLAWWVGRTSWRPRRPRVPRPPAAQLPAASDHGGSISPPGSRATNGANTGGGGAVEKDKEEVFRTMPGKGTGTSPRSFQCSTSHFA